MSLDLLIYLECVDIRSNVGSVTVDLAPLMPVYKRGAAILPPAIMVLFSVSKT